MSGIKCIIRIDQAITSPQGNSSSSEYVTNEDGTPRVFKSLTEAREYIAVHYGKKADRNDEMHNIEWMRPGTDKHTNAYIIRDSSKEYAEIVKKIETAAALNSLAVTIKQVEHLENAARAASAAGQAEDLEEAAEYVNDVKAFAKAAREASRDAYRHSEKARTSEASSAADTASELADYALNIRADAIAQYRQDKINAAEHYQTTDAAARASSSFADAAEWAADKAENDPAADLAEMAHAARIFAAHAQDAADAARVFCDDVRNTTFADYETSGYAARAIELQEIYAADAAAAADRALAAAQRATDAETAAALAAFEDSRPTAEDIRTEFDSPYLVWDDDAAADPEDLEEPAPIYQRHELLAYLGDPDAYDVEAIEAEATTYTADGTRVWSAFGEDLAAIAERHELYTYAPAI